METRAELLEKLENTINQDKDINLILKEIEPIQKAFEDNIEKEINILLEEFVAEGGEPGNFVEPKFEEQIKFKEKVNNLIAKKEKIELEIKKAQEENLKTKKDLIAELRDIIANEENISKAFNRFNAVQEKWKETGEVSPHAYRELQHDYSKALEEFFYHINIYKELKDNDFKKNLSLREELVEKMKALLNEDNIKNVRSLSALYLSEWDEIGPVNREHWEKVRDDFRTVSKKVHEKIKNHFNELKAKQKENLEKKKALVEKVKEITNQTIDKVKTWNKKTDEVLAIQKEWKSIGFATKKDNDKIWEEFKTACNEFFDKKAAFFGEEKNKWDANKKLKEKILEQAEKLKNSTEWKETTNQLVKLQNEWKKIGSAGQKVEQILWNKFRGACDHFFNAKNEFYNTLDDRLAENKKAKEAFIKKLESLKIDKEKGAEEIKKIVAEWESLGMVPKNAIKEINEKYRKAIDILYAQLGLDKNAIENQKFIDKIENLKTKDKADYLLNNEKKFINENIDKLTKEKLQYENNLSFFGFSKGETADKMKKEVQEKIDAVQEKIDNWTKKRQIVSKAVRDLKTKTEKVSEN